MVRARFSFPFLGTISSFSHIASVSAQQVTSGFISLLSVKVFLPGQPVWGRDESQCGEMNPSFLCLRGRGHAVWCSVLAPVRCVCPKFVVPVSLSCVLATFPPAGISVPASSPCSVRGEGRDDRCFFCLRGVGCCCCFLFTLKREKLFFLSVGRASSQPVLGTSVQASLQRADQEIKTALRKLVDSASLLVTLPPGVQGAGGHGLPGPVPSDHLGAAAGPPVHEASTQTQAAGGHGRSGINLERVAGKLRETIMLNTQIRIYFFFPPWFSVLFRAAAG